MRKAFPYILNSLVIVSFLLLPYYLFDGKFFIGGDDTRLQYVFPWEYLQHMSFFSWNNISSVSFHNPNQFSLPLLLILSGLEYVSQSRVFVDYLSFSAPLILGFVYFQLLLKEILPPIGYKETFISALFFVLSPILAQNQLAVFLTPAWLIGLIPILGYYLLKYIKTGKLVYISLASFWALLLSIALYTIPWILGIVFPLLFGLIASTVLFNRSQLWIFIKRTLIYCSAITATQLFWLFPFLSTFFGGGNAIGAKILSSDVASTFRSTVLSTSIGNVFYPLLNLFHRQIIEDFNWQTKSIFENFYDKIAVFDLIYPILIISPLIFFKNILSITYKKVYLLFFCSFLASLYLFTVNVGPFREIFLLGGYLPGFVMFRNFYDKFALGYVFLFSIVLSYAYYFVAQRYPKLKKALFIVLSGLIILNVIPVKSVINSPLWTTQNVYRTILFPKEYLDFLQKTQTIVSPSTNILSIPMDIAAYTIVKDGNTENVYAGTSPIKILAGINDYSGDMSFSAEESNKMNEYVKDKQFDAFNDFLREYNASYIIVTNNIPNEVKSSYLFGGGAKLKDQGHDFISRILGEKVAVSSNGSYGLYKTKERTSLFSLTKGRLLFKKISPVHYILYLANIPQGASLYFRESYHSGWSLFSTNNSFKCSNRKIIYSDRLEECNQSSPLFQFSDIFFLLKKPILSQTQIPTESFGQQWKVDRKYLLDNGIGVTRNSDGTINFTLDLYFKPQAYFYLGSLLSLFSFVLLLVFTIRSLKK